MLELKVQNEELHKFSKGNYHKDVFIAEFKKLWEPTDLQIRMIYLAADLAINSNGVFSVSHHGFLEMYNNRFELKASLSSVRRFFKLLKDLGLIEVRHAKRKNNKQTSNIYIVEPIEIQQETINEQVSEHLDEHASEHAIEHPVEQAPEQQIITLNYSLNNTLKDTLNPNPNPNPVLSNIYEVLWNTGMPMTLKNKIKVMLHNGSIALTNEQILLIEDAYQYQVSKGYVVSDIESDNAEALNDYEFSNTVSKMLEKVKDIHNIRGMIKSWVLQAYSYKVDQHTVSDYSGSSSKKFNIL